MVIGITGHQNIGDPNTTLWVRDQLNKYLDLFHPTLGLSALAIGTDQIFAELCLEKKIPLQAVIPCKYYSKTFSASSLNQYHQLLSQSLPAVQMKHTQPSEEAFWSASCHIVNKSDVLLAVWNAKPAKGFGGTADVVEYARQKHHLQSIIHINPLELETLTIH